MMKKKEGMCMNRISICGSDCVACACFGKLCPGCDACKGRVFHAPNGCPIYLCMEKKGLASCGACSERPCAVWRSTRDPNFTDEAFEQNIRERLERLQK